jgi:twinkle protein
MNGEIMNDFDHMLALAMHEGAVTISDEEYAKYQEDTKPQRMIKEKAVFREEVKKRLAGNIEILGVKTSFNTDGTKFALRNGEVSLWAGVNGHGKSFLTSQIALDLTAAGKKVLICSFEMLPDDTFARMCRQALGQEYPMEKEVDEFMDWKKDHVYVLNHLGTINPDDVFTYIKWACDKFQIEHFIIDSLMKVVEGEDNYNGQKNFVSKLCQLAHQFNIHIHLVHHLAKLRDEYAIGGKMQVKGSGAITDQCDNVFILWKNKEKIDLINKGEIVANDVPDARLYCEKQRHHAWEGAINLWVNKATHQFSTNYGEVKNYLTYNKVVSKPSFSDII